MAATNILSVENLSKRFGERLLFEGITFGLSQGQKTALVARNGSGKSTLLHCICELEPYDEGRVSMGGEVRWCILQQEPPYQKSESILDNLYSGDLDAVQALHAYTIALQNPDDATAAQLAYDNMDRTQAWDFEARGKEILGKLNLHDLTRTMGSLSGGERRRVALAKVLIEEPDLLFLDEPTNHLDLDMIQWLEKYLARSKMTLLMITHDRYFLENVCNTILELDAESLYRYKGNYSYYLEKREERQEIALVNRERARGSFKRELAWMRSTPSARTGKSKARIDRFYEIKKQARIRLEEDPMSIKLNPHRLGGKIVELHKVSQGFGDRTLFSSLTHHFKRFERIGIVGANGSGKSSLLELITQQADPKTGKVVVGETVVFGHYHQSGAQFPEGMRVIEAIYEIAEFMQLQGGHKITASQLLERFLFPRSTHHQFISLLSGGEKKRLHLLQVLMANPNFLILDEPTNDLDIYSLQVLEEFLLDFPGCLIIVSHDRYFMDRLVEHIWVLGSELGEPGAIQDFPGNYSQYRIEIAERQVQQRTSKSASAISTATDSEANVKTAPKNDYTKRLSFKEKFELEQLEKDLEMLEKRKEELTSSLYSTVEHEELTRLGDELKVVTEKLETSEFRWLELSERET
jgi:ATP-binding cassette subfamily F protein uup